MKKAVQKELGMKSKDRQITDFHTNECYIEGNLFQ
jgi:hypothetical protein